MDPEQFLLMMECNPPNQWYRVGSRYIFWVGRRSFNQVADCNALWYVPNAIGATAAMLVLGLRQIPSGQQNFRAPDITVMQGNSAMPYCAQAEARARTPNQCNQQPERPAGINYGNQTQPQGQAGSSCPCDCRAASDPGVSRPRPLPGIISPPLRGTGLQGDAGLPRFPR